MKVKFNSRRFLIFFSIIVGLGVVFHILDSIYNYGIVIWPYLGIMTLSDIIFSFATFPLGEKFENKFGRKKK